MCPHKREAELMTLIEDKIIEVPYVDKLLEIWGVGLKTVIGFVAAEVGGIKRFNDPKELRSWPDMRSSRTNPASTRKKAHQLLWQKSGDQCGEPPSKIQANPSVLNDKAEGSFEEDAVDDHVSM